MTSPGDPGSAGPGSSDAKPAPASDLTTPLYRLPIVALDFEATGLAAWRGDRVCEIGLVAASGDQVDDLMTEFVNPGRPIPEFVQELTGIRDADVVSAPPFDVLLPRLEGAIGDRPIVIHNAPFDLAFLAQGARELGRSMVPNLTIDTLLIARFLNRGHEGNSLSQICDRLGIDRGASHRATDDARAAALAFHALVPHLELRGVRTIGDLLHARLAGPSELLVAEPSSVLLDMLSRAIAFEDVVEIDYARPGERIESRRLKPRHLLGDRQLVAEELTTAASSSGPRSKGERTFRVDRIMRMSHGEKVFISPWCDPSLQP